MNSRERQAVINSVTWNRELEQPTARFRQGLGNLSCSQRDLSVINSVNASRTLTDFVSGTLESFLECGNVSCSTNIPLLSKRCVDPRLCFSGQSNLTGALNFTSRLDCASKWGLNQCYDAPTNLRLY